jgi:hypothetical protein
MPDATRSQHPKLLDDVRQVLRLHRYALHAERTPVEWVVRFVRFHGMRLCEDVFPAEPKIESCLTDLAAHGHAAAAAQNQAMNALAFPHKRARNHALPGLINAARADKKINVPDGSDCTGSRERLKERSLS